MQIENCSMVSLNANKNFGRNILLSISDYRYFWQDLIIGITVLVLKFLFVEGKQNKL